MLEAAGLTISVRPSSVDEEVIKAEHEGTSTEPGDLALILARAKAQQVSSLPDLTASALIVGADQILVLEGKRFDKPRSLSEAADHLRHLSGRTHMLISACSVFRAGEENWHHIDQAELTMRPLSNGFIEHYLTRLGDVALSTVGCYQLEAIGAQLFQQVRGDYFTILGLPLLPLLEYFRTQKVLPS